MNIKDFLKIIFISTGIMSIVLAAFGDFKLATFLGVFVSSITGYFIYFIGIQIISFLKKHLSKT